MLDLFQIGANNDVINDGCGGLRPIVAIIKNGVFPIVQIGIPILLIVFGTIDLGKAVISSDDKEVKQAQSRLIKRCGYAVAIFFITTLVSIIMGLVSKGVDVSTDQDSIDDTSWASCWNQV